MAAELQALQNVQLVREGHLAIVTVNRPSKLGIGLRPLVGTWFQVLLTPLEGVLFTFQSPYWSTIGRAGVLSLAVWSPHVQSEFHELRPTRSLRFASDYRAVTFCGRPFHAVLLCAAQLMGLSAFARRY